MITLEEKVTFPFRSTNQSSNDEAFCGFYVVFPSAELAFFSDLVDTCSSSPEILMH